MDKLEQLITKNRDIMERKTTESANGVAACRGKLDDLTAKTT